MGSVQSDFLSASINTGDYIVYRFTHQRYLLKKQAFYVPGHNDQAIFKVRFYFCAAIAQVL